MTETSSTVSPGPGRPGLQRKDVADAIDALTELGIRDPSLSQLRQHLGRGSNGTISRLRNEIRGERLLATRAPIDGSIESSVLPVLVSAMERFGEDAAKAADDQIAEMRGTFEAAQSKMARERDAAVSDAHDFRIELTIRAEQVKDLRDTVKALRAEVADERMRLDRSEGARKKLEDEAHALLVEVKSLTEARDWLEKSQASETGALANERAAREAAQGKLATLDATNTELQSTLVAQTIAAETSQRLVEALRASQVTLEQRAANAEQGRAAAEGAATATITGVESRLTDKQHIIDALIAKIGNGKK